MGGYKLSKRTKAFLERQEKRNEKERKRLENAERRLRLEEIQRIEREHRDRVETQKSATVEKPVTTPIRSVPYRRRNNLTTFITAALLLCTVPTEVKGDE